ncbi:hypothetical protein D7B24_003454 [Verticillium nonalfalfae]|uniref:Uncharacterized protein n=1 Tax=Verticillium nonalfalfae TaxID=1051616 RepID=A0A3M9YM47_9PEZI|nr:uncharacterized protein D7B24_003454 [Verticillium nonalfalfae]RNJ61042.1 hypothetical protein D7B24_003454 [Verticillium nonalfalfae]
MMNRPSFQPIDYEEAVMDDAEILGLDARGDMAQAAAPAAAAGTTTVTRSPLSKLRSLSDGGGTPARLSPSPLILETTGKATSKDDNHIRDTAIAPSTPRRVDFTPKGLSLHMPPHQRDFASPPPPSAAASAVFTKPAPLSPKLDHSYASPTNILPRRSRGLDFSRAATSLHHSTLAEQSSPDSSPTIGGGRAMNIPQRRSNDYNNAEQLSNSLWSMMGNQERMNISSSLGSAHPFASDSSSDDDMDEDMDDAIVTTPQVNRTGGPLGSPAVNSLLSFQQRQRPRKQPRKKSRGPLGLGFGSASAGALSKSPPIAKDIPMSHSRRESISWQANQLHISSADEDRMGGDSINGVMGISGQKPRHTIMRQVAARRGNLMPKTKNFARIKHALLEEGAPVETEVLREREVIRQVRESDVDLEPRTTTAQSSPNLVNQDIDEVPGEDMNMNPDQAGLSSSFKQQAIKNSKGAKFWDTFSESSSIGNRTTPPPPSFNPRGSSSGISEDINMDSPSLGATASFAMAASSGESTKGDTPNISQPAFPQQSQQGPSAAEITRRINSKRRREDDFDPVSFKRRAVSPGMSVHNSPIMQSPRQRESAPWGSRPGSNGGERADRGGSGAASDTGSGSLSGTPGNGGRLNGGKGRVGFQGMVDTNDHLMRMSIE